MKLRFLAFLILALALIAAFAPAAAKKWYEEKSFEEWSGKQIESFLKKSPWAKSQTYIPSSGGRVGSGKRMPSTYGGSSSRAAGSVYFRVQWLSARPIRMALARNAMLRNPSLTVDQVKNFATAAPTDTVVRIAFESNDAGVRSARSMQMLFQRLNLDGVAGSTTLTTKSGKEVKPINYQPPTEQDPTAKFQFPRTMPDGTPLLEPDDNEARFTFKTPINRGNETLKIDLKFKLKDMMYNGVLEY